MNAAHFEVARRQLLSLARIADTTRDAERRILEAAMARLEAVDADIDRLRGRALLDEHAGQQYSALIEERGRLALVIARAREHLL